MRFVDQNNINTRVFTLELFVPLNQVINSYQVNIPFLYPLDTSENKLGAF